MLRGKQIPKVNLATPIDPRGETYHSPHKRSKLWFPRRSADMKHVQPTIIVDGFNGR